MANHRQPGCLRNNPDRQVKKLVLGKWKILLHSKSANLFYSFAEIATFEVPTKNPDIPFSFRGARLRTGRLFLWVLGIVGVLRYLFIIPQYPNLLVYC